MTRTVVSFEGPTGAFPTRRGGDDFPPGRQIASLVSDALAANGIEHTGPDEREGWAWDLRARSEHGAIQSTVGLVDDAPIQCLIVTTVTPRRRLFGGRRAEAATAADSMRDAWIRSVAKVTNGPHGLTNVRWYSQDDFDRDHGDTWAADPFD